MRTDFLSKSCKSIALFLRDCRDRVSDLDTPELHELEQRVFYDASPLGVILDDIGGDSDFVENVDLMVADQFEAATHEDFSYVPDLEQLDSPVNEIVFIDRNVQDYSVLIHDLAGQSDVAVFVLDPSVDGVQQISETLGKYSQISAVHIVSHGDQGFFQLGASTVSLDNLHLFSDQFAQWGNSLSADADLLIYGCNVAGSENGQELIESLEALTGADVAASEDLTGNSELGGNWVFEYTAGAVESNSVFSELVAVNWMSTLDVTGYPISFGADNSLEHISNVTYAGINHSSGAEIGGYSDNSSQVATVLIGQSNSISVTIVSPDPSDYVTAWIDWNQDKDFDDVGEEYVVATNVGPGGSYNINIVTPNGALIGTTIMRVSVSFNVAPVSSGVILEGEVEDYSVTVTTLNDDPTNAGSLPSDVGVTEDVLSNIDLSLIDFSDVDAGGSSLTATLSTATGGELTVAAGTGITLGGTATARTFTGTLTDLNNYFNTASNVQYLHATPHTNGDNADSITVLINDNGNTGFGGGANQNLGAVNVDISAVNDTPVVSGPGSAYLVNEQAGLSIEGTGFTLVDVDAGSGTMTGTFSVGEGGITVSVGNSGVAIGSGNGTGTVVVTGTASQINNLLTGAGTGSITYLNGSDTPSSSTVIDGNRQ